MRIFLGLVALFAANVSQAGISDAFRSPTGVYAWREQTELGNISKLDTEELDVRDDNTFIWTMTTRLTAPNSAPVERRTEWRGRWKWTGSNLSLFMVDAPLREFRIDSRDLIEKTGLKRRFVRRRM